MFIYNGWYMLLERVSKNYSVRVDGTMLREPQLAHHHTPLCNMALCWQIVIFFYNSIGRYF
ncbi:hypothetical protein FH5T_17810 [Draconibacterium orientale]|jgi:hypothetical protein|uniref:Uncharacterized protein n=1 Tax=Draconibacterium orientale TaxID=1168034 RepID=A0ABM5QEP4_9BACT|nr:hypothetical protein FH5T_17810 [Draconibacterium orientale]